MKDDVDVVLLLQLVHDDLDVQLSLTADEELLGLLVAVEPDGRIFFDDAGHGDAELVLVAARFRLDREGDRRLRVVDVLDGDLMILGGDGVAGGGVLQLRHRTDVAALQLGHGNLLLALQELQLADALFVVARGVPVAGVGLERAGVDAEERDAAGERIGEGLEHERGGERLGAAVEGDFFALRILAGDGLRLVRGGQQRDHRVEDGVSADVVRRRAEEQREDLMMRDLALETVDQLFL